jgi:hypothetical protein
MVDAINFWGPAMLVSFAILIGVMIVTNRTDSLRGELTARIDLAHADLTVRIEALQSDLAAMSTHGAEVAVAVTARIDRLEKRLVDRIERPGLES